MTRRVVALLEVMYDWRGMTSGAGYEETAPPYYTINPDNKSGRVLYSWLGRQGEHYDELLVTNACPQLVTGPNQRGTPDKSWVSKNLKELAPFSLLLVCGAVAAKNYYQCDAENSRIIELPHPAARTWTREDLAFAGRLIRESQSSLWLHFRAGRLHAQILPPF